jgi:hypothetical protein
MSARTAQIPSLRILPAQKKLIEEAAKASGLSVTDWAREQLLHRATEQKMDPTDEVQRVLPAVMNDEAPVKSPSKPPPPKRTKSGTQMKAIRPEAIKPEDEVSPPMLIAGMRILA